jgi:hypothetical protein
MYEEIDDAIRVAEARNEEGFVGCVTVRLDVLKRWRAHMQGDRPAQAPCEKHHFDTQGRCYNCPVREPEQAPHGALGVAEMAQMLTTARAPDRCTPFEHEVTGLPFADTTKPEEPGA